jgi:CRISP-associated protein Cas1
MARGWRVLDATSFDGVVGGARGRLTFVDDVNGNREVPAEEIAVVLLGTGASLDAAALHYATKHDVAVLFSDWRGVPFGGLYPWSAHTRVGARHIAQANLSAPRRKNAWMQIVKAKIRGQAATLAELEIPGNARLLTMASEVRSGDPSNVEGAAARYYWPRLFGRDDRFVRDQDGSDDVNGMLNYGYTVLRGFGIRAALAAGLSTPNGVFHRGRSNYFNLVDDLIEPFRPAIDSAVARLDVGSSLSDPLIKKAVVAAASQPFSSDGSRIPAALDDLAQQLGRYVEGDIDKLNVTSWAGTQYVDSASSDGEE